MYNGNDLNSMLAVLWPLSAEVGRHHTPISYADIVGLCPCAVNVSAVYKSGFDLFSKGINGTKRLIGVDLILCRN